MSEKDIVNEIYRAVNGLKSIRVLDALDMAVPSFLHFLNIIRKLVSSIGLKE